MEQLQKIKDLNLEKTPFDRTRRVHRVKVTWDESKLGINARKVMQELAMANLALSFCVPVRE